MKTGVAGTKNMTMNNERSDTKAEQLDVEHELPGGEGQNLEGSAPEQEATAAEDRPKIGTEAAKADEQCKVVLDRLARLQAEFENARKRAAREQQEFKDYALAEALKSLLPTLDSLDLALQVPTWDFEEFRNGVDLIRKQFEDALSKLGVSQIPAKGVPFDPRIHQAIEMVDTISAPYNQVLEEVQRGYMLRDRLLRPALVRVARNPKRSEQREAA